MSVVEKSVKEESLPERMSLPVSSIRLPNVVNVLQKPVRKPSYMR